MPYALFLNNMEKSSEKVIGSSRLAPNPFNNLMSEVQIKINQPKSTKKIDNYALEIDSNIDRSASNYLPEPTRPAKKDSPPQSQSKIVHQNVYLINVPLKTKHSSDTVGRQKSEKDIINEWLIGFMAKRHLLGVHWEENFGEKNEELMQVAFQRIKGRAENSMECNTQQDKAIRLTNVYSHMEKSRVGQCFLTLKEFYKDDLLFGLSNTLGQERDHSLMLNTDSVCESLSLQSKNLNKQPRPQMQEYSFSESQSNKNLTKKGSESGSVSEDLSNLILNHNKLKLEDELNRSVPNIPKSKSTQRSIKTNREIGELCIQTKKQINTQKRLGEEMKHDGLPLESNANLAHTKKEIIAQDQPKGKEKGQEGKPPVTITFILHDMNNISLMKPENKAELAQAQSKIQPRTSNLQIPQRPSLLDQSGINSLPFTESFYQNAATPPTRPLQVIQPSVEQPKRSTSLQIKRGYQPLFPQIHQEPNRNPPRKQVFVNEYYPEQTNRDNIRFSKENMPLIVAERVRPKSATPKITFTFTSNNAPNSHIKCPTQSKVTNHATNAFPSYEHHDYIVESVLHPRGGKVVAVPERNKNRLQVVSPCRNGQGYKKMPPNRLALDNRQHIRNNLLPAPLSFNDYYGAQSGQKTLKSQRSSGQIVFMDNQVIYSDNNLQKSATHHSFLGCSPPEGMRQMRMRSPNDKIFVSYAGPCQF